MFFVLCGLIKRALVNQEYLEVLKKYSGFAAILLTALYGAVDEFYQKFVPGRTSDIYDVVADTAGGLLYLLVFWLFSRKKAVATPIE